VVPPGTSPPPGKPISLAPPRSATPSHDPASIETAPDQPPGKPVNVGANKLPEPPLSPEASPEDFLRAARDALAARRNGEARSALEMAQTRLLDRVVAAGTERQPDQDLAVKQISQAIEALRANDRLACLRYIQFASHTLGHPLE
jgi:hypothetical protein